MANPPVSATRDFEFWRFVVNRNPFYFISAACMLHGASRAAEPASHGWTASWVLWGLLAGYAAVLGVVATALVRWVPVWEDVRSIVVTVLLVLLATSCLFDERLLAFPREGHSMLGTAGGAALAGLLSLQRALRLKLSWRFQVPLYATVAYFFAYPILLERCLNTLGGEATTWAALAFPLVGAGLLMGFLPAANCERRARHQSPWPWPGYPWSAFAVLLAAVALRAPSLVPAFDVVGPENAARAPGPFNPFALAPLPLAAAAVALELARAARSRRWQAVALTLPVAAGLVACAAESAVSQQRLFVEMLLAVGCGPVWLAALGMLVFYSVACLRGVPGAGVWTSTVIAALAFVEPQTIGWKTLAAAPRPEWFLAAAIALFVATPDWPRVLRGAGCGAFLLAAALGASWSAIPPDFRMPVALHAALALLFVAGACGRDDVARALTGWGAVGLALTGIMVFARCRELLPIATLVYLGAVCIGVAIYAVWLRREEVVAVIFIDGVLAALQAGGFMHAALLGTFLKQAVGLLELAALTLFVAVLLSVAKARRSVPPAVP